MKNLVLKVCCCCLGTLVLNLTACNSGVESVDAGQDTTAVISTDTSAQATDALPATDKTDLVDSLVKLPEDISNERKSATLGYSYPPVMRRDEVKNINVYVLIRNQHSRIKDTLRAIALEQAAKYDDNDSVSVEIRNVIWYKTLAITLIDPAGDFKIVPIHNSEKQVIDTINGNKWRWSIQTKTDKKETMMILKVVAEKEDGTVDHFDDRTIYIEIKIERNIFRRFLHYMLDKPEVSVPILVSLFGFLGWYIKRRVEKNK